MKILRRLIIVLLPILVVLAGCAASDNAKIKSAIKDELAVLSELDEDSVSNYIQGTNLLSEILPMDTASSDEIKNTFILFFKDFDYKVQSVEINKDQHTATAIVRLRTLDAKTLSEDYAAALLRTEIKKTADTGDSQASLTSTERYLILYELLSSNDYTPTQNTIEMTLSEDNGTWKIDRTEVLENALTGGLPTYLQEPDILSPSETLEIYLSSLKDMDAQQMANYLGIKSLIRSEDTTKKKIANALIDQVKKHYNYTITDTTWEGAKAIVNARITTFDSESILEDYIEDVNEYLASADAVIDGVEKRTSVAQEKLLSYISDNKDNVTTNARFEMENDGNAWRLISPGEDLGNALFGSLIETPQ